MMKITSNGNTAQFRLATAALDKALPRPKCYEMTALLCTSHLTGVRPRMFLLMTTLADELTSPCSFGQRPSVSPPGDCGPRLRVGDPSHHSFIHIQTLVGLSPDQLVVPTDSTPRIPRSDHFHI